MKAMAGITVAALAAAMTMAVTGCGEDKSYIPNDRDGQLVRTVTVTNTTTVAMPAQTPAPPPEQANSNTVNASYGAGYEAGRSECSRISNNNSAYSYDEGYNAGYEAGFQAGLLGNRSP